MSRRRSKKATPPMPYSGISHGRNAFTFRDAPGGRQFGYFCEACEKIPPWQK